MTNNSDFKGFCIFPYISSKLNIMTATQFVWAPFVLSRLKLTRPTNITGTIPKAQESDVVAYQKYYKRLYGYFSNHVYLVVKNSNKNTSEFLTLSPCLNL